MDAVLSVKQGSPDYTGRKVKPGAPHLLGEWHCGSSPWAARLCVVSLLRDLMTDVVAFPTVWLQNSVRKQKLPQMVGIINLEEPRKKGLKISIASK